jgi:hypothetical protein
VCQGDPIANIKGHSFLTHPDVLLTRAAPNHPMHQIEREELRPFNVSRGKQEKRLTKQEPAIPKPRRTSAYLRCSARAAILLAKESCAWPASSIKIT